jgi:hypothetical protein
MLLVVNAGVGGVGGSPSPEREEALGVQPSECIL